MVEIKCPHCGKSFPLEKYLTSEHIKEIADVDIQKKVAEQVKLAQKEISKNYEKKKKDELERKAREIKEANKKKLEEVEELKDKAVEEERRKKQLELDEKQLKLDEKQLKIDRLNQKIRELGVKPGGDSELSGETFEEMVKATAQKEFPGFSVEDVEKGKKGADLIITTLRGAKILIEAKNVKNFQSGFVDKIKEDIVREGASHGIIVTNGVMPKSAKDKKYEDAGPLVSIVEFSNFIPALRIRVSMIDQIIEAEWKLEGSKTKKD